jgi:hypothetical protein
VIALSTGLLLKIDALTAGAMLLLAMSLGLTAALLLAAVVSGIRNVRSASP